MPGDFDHLQAFVNRLRLKRQALDQQARKIDDTIRAIEEGIGSLSKESGNELKAFAKEQLAERSKPGGTRIQNRNVTELVREYVVNLQPTHATSFEDLRSAAISIRSVVEFLQKNGCKGEYRSLYSSAAIILKKEADKGRGIRYMKGVGFYKPVKQSETEKLSGVHP